MTDTGIALRDSALSRVHRADWIAEALAAFDAHCDALPDTFIGEDIRLLVSQHAPAPHHANAWGGFIRGLVTSKRIEPTGGVAPMRSPGSHARRTFEYRLRTE